MKRIFEGKRGQVWVETVIYTLIGLAIIGLVLATAKPKIDDQRSKVSIEQAIEALGNINNKIFEVQRAAGNQRRIDLKIGKGKFVIDTTEDTLSWVLGSTLEYSEVDSTISIGSINVTTRESTPYEVELKIGYALDIQYNGQTVGVKEFSEAPIPYVLTIENMGVIDGNIVISIREA
ncbi:MAG: hypothetical protein IH845_02835 [Nanoarchaeota archaeon]|nr:hypothetical protein [Nanoarchaeota archaeon]